MSTKINKRAVPPPRDPANRPSVEALQQAVNELSGAVGAQVQRAVRVCELVDAGLLTLLPNGQLGRDPTNPELGVVEISDVTGLPAALDGKVSKAGDTMTGRLVLPAAGWNAVGASSAYGLSDDFLGWGLYYTSLPSPPGVPSPVFTLTGNQLSFDATPKVGVNDVWHAGTFTPASKADVGGANATGTWPISITGSAPTLTTARTLTIGSTGKTFNGSANVSWSLGEIGAAAAAHTHPISDITNLQTSLDAKASLSGANFTGRVRAASGTASEVIGSSANGRGQIEVLSGGTGGTAGAAFISYHRGGNFAAYMGLDTDNKFKVGGWSMGSVAHEIWHAGNQPVDASLAPAGNTLAKRDASGDVSVRLIRATFGNEGYLTGAMAFRVNNGADNYIRFCSDTNAIRTFLNVPALGANANFAHLQATSARLVIQNGADGGNARGIFLWTSADPNWGVYMSTAGAGKSLSGGTACTSLSGRAAHHARFRAGSATTQGFIWENQLETCLMSLDGDTGRLRVAGNIDLNGAFLGAWPGASTYKGLIAADGSYLIMTGSGDPQTYVGAQPGRDIVLRPNGNDVNGELRVLSTSVEVRKPIWRLNASGGFTKQPVIFVQSADPGAAAADGDIWLW